MPVPTDDPRATMRVSNGGSASRAGAAWTPLDVGPALRGALVPLNAPLVPGGAVHVSCEGRFLVVAQNAVHIFTPTVSFHPLLNPERDAVFHTQIPREAASLDDWKDRPFYLDQMLVPSHTFWTRTWLDARWAPDLTYLASGVPLVAALSNEYMIAVFEPEADAQTSNWICRQLLSVPSNGDEVLAELDAQLTCLDWLTLPTPQPNENVGRDKARPLVTGARSGRVSAWVWDWDVGALVPYAHFRLATEQITRIALTANMHGVLVAAATASRVYTVLLKPDGTWSTSSAIPANYPQAVLWSQAGNTLTVMSTGQVDIMHINICTGNVPGEGPIPPSADSFGPVPVVTCTQSYLLSALVPDPSSQAGQCTPERETSGPAEEPGEEDELVAHVAARVLSPFSPLCALQELSTGEWSVVLSNGATYIVPGAASGAAEPLPGLPEAGSVDLPAKGTLIVESRRGKSTDAQRLALAQLQDVTACVVVAARSHETRTSPAANAMRSAFALAARSDDVLAPLQFRGIHARVQVGVATLAPALAVDELVEQGIACVLQGASRDAAFFTHTFAVAAPADRAAAAVRILDHLSDTDVDTDARAALWLAAWLKARDPEPQRAGSKLYAHSFRTEIKRRLQLPVVASEPTFAARQQLADAVVTGTSGNTEAGNMACPACEKTVPFGVGTAQAGGQEAPLLKGICEGGHTWRRCSVTFRLVMGAHARRCGTCLVHALLPSDPEVSIAEAAVLGQATRCTLCGGMWMVQ